VARRLFVLCRVGEQAGRWLTVSQGRRLRRTLEAPRREVVAALASLLERGDSRTIEKTLRVHGALLERAIEATHGHRRAQEQFLAAWQRYSGVVWTHLDPHTLSVEQRRRILVPSGLLGVTTAQDPVCDYRLKMNVSLFPLGGLATFWRPRITPALPNISAGPRW